MSETNEETKLFSPQDLKLQLRAKRIVTQRKILGFIAIGSLVALLGFLVLNIIRGIPNRGEDLVKGDQLVLENPRFIGHSKSGGQITITAQNASRELGNQSGSISLASPKLVSSNGTEITGDIGIWNQSTQDLALENNVSMKTKSGDRITSDNAVWHTFDGKVALDGGVVISMKDGSAISQSAIYDTVSQIAVGNGNTQITFNFAIGTAQKYEYYSLNRRIKLIGGAKLVFRNKNQQ